MPLEVTNITTMRDAITFCMQLLYECDYCLYSVTVCMLYRITGYIEFAMAGNYLTIGIMQMCSH